MNERDYWTVKAMEARGGSFVQALAVAAMRADPHNLAKIKATFADYWKEYEEVGRVMEGEKEDTL